MKFGSNRAFGRLTLSAVMVCACLAKPSLAGAGTITDDKRGSNRADERNSAGKIIERVVTAWNKNDTESIAELFLPDAVLVTPTGSVVRSRSAIRKRIIDERNGKLKNTTLRNVVEGVSLPTSNTAVVNGKYQLEGMKVLGFATSPEGSFVLHQRKQQGRWMIAKAEILRRRSN